MIKRSKIFLTLLALLLVPTLTWAMPWSWDLFDQPSHKGQEEEALALPSGTVPVKGKPLAIGSMQEAALIKSPFGGPTAQSIKRGLNRFKIYCVVCHGAGGKGDGLVGKKYVPPTDLTSGYVQNKTAGEIYYAITYGGLGIMPTYADSMDPEDRWHIANYILYKLKNDNANNNTAK